MAALLEQTKFDHNHPPSLKFELDVEEVSDYNFHEEAYIFQRSACSCFNGHMLLIL